MGVPALFRWLSRKYPKIAYPVVEEEEVKVDDVTLPIDMSNPNPNGTEFDNLYLDMNGIVHPCTHPEGKPAPETEEEMMVAIFEYTERVVNMIRPRKLLFMAIDGVAPRAKMNQQRSRRFRAAQEAKEKEQARQESILLWESMGKALSDEEKNKKSWDSNAITPGTPFMDLLSQSLRYWVVQKLNSDPGWKQIEVIISDASVPGEGEHKIMEYIRRSRTNSGHDPNTRHVIYGLDADLIMLSLATHEPHFRVLREDVFGKDTSPTACRKCGQEGHIAANCTGQKVEQVTKPAEKKPFIFLDVSILREYLEIELNVSTPFPFNLEQAIDDWVMLIFFVGNDFLPHLPSLEIREGAIDTLLEIWKKELPRMGGYLTNHGRIELARAQLILEGLAMRESNIFKRRREAEERQEHGKKHRRVENKTFNGPPAALTGPINTGPHGLPPRPNFPATADSIGLGMAPTPESAKQTPTAVQALAGSNRDVVANRAAIRMANMSAAEMLKAEMAGAIPLGRSKGAKPAPPPVAAAPAPVEEAVPSTPATATSQPAEDDDIPGLRPVVSPTVEQPAPVENVGDASMEGDSNASGPDPDAPTEDISMEPEGDSIVGVKRKADEQEDDEEGDEEEEAPSNALKVNADGTVEQEDKVKLWEAGYQERYYQQKFGVPYTDKKFVSEVAKHYLEGLAWVLHYYYQGTPSWQWFYPYHFAPFAADFVDISKLDIQFTKGEPFKPFEQLMGVFPAASRQHIPTVFHDLMTSDDSPIIDFYPTSFEIDMNGKKMVWQGVALLPFIDSNRLLEAMQPRYPGLTKEEVIRNDMGNNLMFVADEHSLYPFVEGLYGKRKNSEPQAIDPVQGRGLCGSLLPNPDCLPGSTYYCPLTEQGLPDIKNDRSLSALYFFPKLNHPHRSVLLPGVKRPQRVLSQYDMEKVRRGRGGGPGRDNGGGRSGYGGVYGGNGLFHSAAPPNERAYRNGPGAGGHPTYRRDQYGDGINNNNNNNTGGYGGYGSGNNHHRPTYPQQQNYNNSQSNSYQSSYRGGGGGGGGAGYNGYNNGGQYNSRGLPPPTRGGRGSSGGGGGYGGYNNAPQRGGYGGGSGGGGGGYNNNNDYGGYGGYGGGGRGGFNAGSGGGGYGTYGGGRGGGGGYGAQPSYNNHNNHRGAPSRGRGRGY